MDGPSGPNRADRLVVRLGRSAPTDVGAWLESAPADAVVVFGDDAGDGASASIDDVAREDEAGRATLWARLSPVTDAIKRVEGDLLVDTVDRAVLRLVGPPMVMSAGLARRWWSAQTGRSPDGRPEEPIDVAALLSELVSIEPDLRVVDLGPVLQPGASHG